MIRRRSSSLHDSLRLVQSRCDASNFWTVYFISAVRPAHFFRPRLPSLLVVVVVIVRLLHPIPPRGEVVSLGGSPVNLDLNPRKVVVSWQMSRKIKIVMHGFHFGRYTENTKLLNKLENKQTHSHIQKKENIYIIKALHDYWWYVDFNVVCPLTVTVGYLWRKGRCLWCVRGSRGSRWRLATTAPRTARWRAADITMDESVIKGQKYENTLPGMHLSFQRNVHNFLWNIIAWAAGGP